MSRCAPFNPPMSQEQCTRHSSGQKPRYHLAKNTQIPTDPAKRRFALFAQALPRYFARMADTYHLEEQIAHLTRTVEDLSDIVARQENELALVLRRLAMLMEREAGRELDAGGSVPLADQRPPHW